MNLRNIIYCVFLLAVFSSSVRSLTLTEIVNAPKKVVKQEAQPFQPDGTQSVPKESRVPKAERRTPFSSFTKKDVEGKVQEELQIKYGDRIAIKFAPWHLPGRQFENISQFIVEAIEVNQQRTKIAALVHFQLKGVLKTLKIRGRLEHMIEVPTLNRPVHYGEMIKKEDISWTKIPGHKSNRFLITTPENLIGHQPRSGFLKVGLPLYQRDIEKVKDIEKGSMVTVHYKTDKLELVTKARALEHGYKGDTIRILNEETNKILRGAVIGANTISLTPDYKQDIQP